MTIAGADTFSSLIRFPKLYSAALTLVLLGGCSGDSDNNDGQAMTDSGPAGETETAQMPQAGPAVSAAMQALGMDGMQTLSYSGTAWRVRDSFRQTLTASPPWPERDTITDYRRTIDLEAPASRATGETFASNLFLEPPVAGTYSQNIRADQRDWARQLEIWLTPWGFLQGAVSYGADEEAGTLDGRDVTVVSWQSPEDQVSPSGMRYTVVGYIDGDNLLRRVETRVEDAFMGDMNVVALYEDYQQIDGRWVPETMEQQRGGGGVFGLVVEDLDVNPANAAELLTMPESQPGGFGGAPANAMVKEVAEGVHLIQGSYVAMVVEFSDHVAVFEAGGSEANGELILALVRELHPDKELRYLINSHPHSDHTAGMVPLVRAGATIVTHQSNVDFLRAALGNSRELLGEETLQPEFYPDVGQVTVLEDETRRLELHQIKNLHSVGTLVAYLPNEGILFQADFTLPQPGAEANPFVVDLANYVAENDLQFDQYLAVHAASGAQTREDLLATIGQ